MKIRKAVVTAAGSDHLHRPVPHVVTTSYLTHQPLEFALKNFEGYGYEGPLLLSQAAP